MRKGELRVVEKVVKYYTSVFFLEKASCALMRFIIN